MESTVGEGGRWRLRVPPAMRAFTVIWFGQLVSFVGTGMTNFGLMIWAFQQTGHATSFVLVFFFAYMPAAALSPLAGAVVDRFSRKTILVLIDTAAAVGTLCILALHQTGLLELWYIYGILTVTGAFHAFQWPAITAATTMLVPKEHYGRASGMMSFAYSTSDLAAPIMAALLLTTIGLEGVLAFDLLTFAVGISALLLIPIPAPPVSRDAREAKGTIRDDMAFGFRYIFVRRSLLGLMGLYFVFNIVTSLGWVLFQPMILARAASDEVVLGSVLAMGAVGNLVGGSVMSVWGGPKRRINGVIGGLVIMCLGGMCVIGLGRGFLLWAAGLMVITLIDPVVVGCNQAIWQSKVPPDVQGRVFSARMFIALIGTAPIVLMAGPLADEVFEPLMDGATGLAAAVFGSGDGAGMALLVFTSGLLGLVVSVAAYGFRSVRDVEDILPDHDEVDGGGGTDGGTNGSGTRDANGPEEPAISDVGEEAGSEEALQEGAGEAQEGGRALEQGSDEP